MITRQTVLFLGFSQLICWGISYYLIASFGDQMAADLNWSSSVVYGGFSVALIVMALTSPLSGRMIDRHGGRSVMTAGSLLLTVSCAGIALSYSVPIYYASWLLLGFAMRLTLYDAAFATLARIGGAEAKRAIAQVTLLGGLASTVFWPVGFFLSDAAGWRAALLCYAFFALLTVPLHLTIPKESHSEQKEVKPEVLPKALKTAEDRKIAGGLYALIFTLLNFLNSAMSAHMINLLIGAGLGASLAVWVSASRGIGQSLARVCEVLFGSRLHPLTLTVFAASVLPFCFFIGLFSGQFLLAAFIFTFFYGAGTGLMTITRGTLPLVLFETKTYGSFVGKLLVPSFLLSAAAPVVYTEIIGKFGEGAALYLSAVLACIIFGMAVTLKVKYGRTT